MNDIAKKAIASAVTTLVPLAIASTVAVGGALIDQAKAKKVAKRAAKEQAKFDAEFDKIVAPEQAIRDHYNMDTNL